MRLFIAVRLSDEVRGALRALQDDLARRGVRGNYTRPENLHLTLAFIGEYPDPDRVLEVMEGVDFAPFPLGLRGLGSFGSLWWAGLERTEGLTACVRGLRRALAEADIPFDRKRFSPHITLVRKASLPPGGMPGVPVPAAAMTAERISLMRSDRGRHGMIYRSLGSVPARDRR